MKLTYVVKTSTIALCMVVCLAGCGERRNRDQPPAPEPEVTMTAAPPTAPSAEEATAQDEPEAPEEPAPTAEETIEEETIEEETIEEQTTEDETTGAPQATEETAGEAADEGTADEAAAAPVDTPAPAADATSACSAAGIHFVGLGGEVDWSPDGTRLVFDRRDEAGIYQLRMIAPDGSGEQCISCAEVEGGPSLDRHKGFPFWHPSGEYLVTQVEMERHLPIKALAEPGRGGWNNLYALTPDGQQWWQLTDYSGLESSGVLNPRFSPDGTKLFWAEKIGRVSRGTPFAQWQLVVADFVVDESGPHLENLVSMRPGEGGFYESHGFSRDGKQILFTSDIGLSNPFALDVFLYTLETGELLNLTNSPEEWDEHAAYAYHADKIALMSSRCCPAYDANAFGMRNLGVLQTEAYVMNPDGSDVQQVTHFNTPGAPEYAEEHSAATVISWHPDGTRLAVAQLFVGDSYDTMEGRKLWIVDFPGVCQ